MLLRVSVKELYGMKTLPIFLLSLLLFSSGCIGDGKENTESYNLASDKNRTWYEIFVYSFYDSDGDGTGDLNGVTQKLDYIQDLGFNGIWLMPVHPSATYHKYDVIDYLDIDPDYGTLEDFDRLIEECGKRGIAVMMDLVLNHTSVSHPWFEEGVAALSAGDADNKYIDYYNFSKDIGNGQWQSACDGWYYECQFWSGMPDLNLYSQSLWEDIENIMEFWIDRGVKAFRLDAVLEYETGNRTKNIEILRRINDTAKAIDPDIYIVGEGWDTSVALYELYRSEVDSFFNFVFAGAEGKTGKTVLLKNQKTEDYINGLIYAQEEISAINPAATDAVFFTNHDTARAAGFLRQDPSLIKIAWGMNLMQSGNVFVYYGEEIGMSGSGRDENKRQPMYWTAERGTPGIPMPPPESEAVTHKQAPVDEQIKDDYSILNYIKNGIEIRNKYPEIKAGTIEDIFYSDGDKVCACTKVYEDSQLMLVYNISDSNAQINVDTNLTISDGLYTGEEKAVLDKGILTLPPYSISILKPGQ